MKWISLLLLPILAVGCVMTHSNAKGPTGATVVLKQPLTLPPLPPPKKKSVDVRLVTIVTLTNQAVTQVWISRGSNAKPTLAIPPVVRQLRTAAMTEPPGPKGVIHPVVPTPPEPAKWMQADWTNWETVPRGDLDIQMKAFSQSPWVSWATVPMENWMPGPNIILQIGWQVSDDNGIYFKDSEYMRIVITPR